MKNQTQVYDKRTALLKKSVDKSVRCFEKAVKAGIDARKKSAPLPAFVATGLFCASLVWLGYEIFLSIAARF